jgi:hypothetical protein
MSTYIYKSNQITHPIQLLPISWSREQYGAHVWVWLTDDDVVFWRIPTLSVS